MDRRPQSGPRERWQDLIVDLYRLHPDHLNRSRVIGILKRLKRKRAPIRNCAATPDSLRSVDTYPLIQAEVIDTHPPRIQFRSVMTGEAETSPKRRNDNF